MGISKKKCSKKNQTPRRCGARCELHTLGLGSGASTALLLRLARKGHGSAQFLADGAPWEVHHGGNPRNKNIFCHQNPRKNRGFNFDVFIWFDWWVCDRDGLANDDWSWGIQHGLNQEDYDAQSRNDGWLLIKNTEHGCLKGPDQSKSKNDRLTSLSKQEWEVNGF